MRLFRSHGLKKSQFHWDYEILFHSLNYRLSDINCALAMSQIKKIKKFINFRKEFIFFIKNNFIILILFLYCLNIVIILNLVIIYF